MPRWPLTSAERFAAKWVADVGTGCHVWIAQINQSGYGKFQDRACARELTRRKRATA
jgi:hypothetical protein